MDIERQPIDPQLRERRERIATAVLAQLVGTAGEFRPDHRDTAMKAANELIDALDSEGA